MERRHQVFVSSTYRDLEDERQEIIMALLELDCMPAGMELFPATDENAWSLIKSVIDDSDYYVLVIGGRYGSTGADGIGYTENEYDYALATNKPVIAFLHKDPQLMPAHRCESTDAGKSRLAAFRLKVEANNHVKYWSSSAELGGLVSRGIVHLKKRRPSDGWVPGRFATTEATILEQERLMTKIKELEAELLTVKQAATTASSKDDLASGTDKVSVTLAYRPQDPKETEPGRFHVTTTWNEILRYVGPSLIGECDNEQLDARIKLAFYHKLSSKQTSEVRFTETVMPHVELDKIKLQLRALGYMAPGTKRRAVSDNNTYWALTSSGEAALFQLTAKKKNDAEKELAQGNGGGEGS